jgi:hypothetical protein
MFTGSQVERAGRLAKELYETDSRNLRKAVLYAYGLKLQGKADEGAKIFDGRNDLPQLTNDGHVYCVLIFSACGRLEEARRFAGSVRREDLLPELRAALDQVFENDPS